MMDGIGLDGALSVIEEDLRNAWQPNGGHSVDVWLPGYARKTADGGVHDGGERRADDRGHANRIGVELRLMADDGNFLVAVLTCSQSKSSIREHDLSDAVRKLRIEGNKIRRTVLDAGLHRLVVLMVLPDAEELYMKLSKELPQAKEGMGQFRTVLLPSANMPGAEFVEAYGRRRAAVGPLPSSKFLQPVDEAELAGFVGEVLDQLPELFREAVSMDISTFLREGDWSEGTDWPRTRRAVDECIRGFSPQHGAQ